MPKYVYHCNECNGDFETVHGMTERQEKCELCSISSCLRRIPQMPNIKTSNYEDNDWEQNKKAGVKVREAISENSEILKQQKKEVASWEYEPK
jgi:putative FmdB family regulatory protein